MPEPDVLRLTWDEHARLACFRQPAEVRGHQARRLIGDLEERIGTERLPFAVLVDATLVRSTDAEWRTAWSEFYRAHLDDGALAIFGANTYTRIVIAIFAAGTRMRVDTFSSEAAARSWLERVGRPR